MNREEGREPRPPRVVVRIKADGAVELLAQRQTVRCEKSWLLHFFWPLSEGPLKRSYSLRGGPRLLSACPLPGFQFLPFAVGMLVFLRKHHRPLSAHGSGAVHTPGSRSGYGVCFWPVTAQHPAGPGDSFRDGHRPKSGQSKLTLELFLKGPGDKCLLSTGAAKGGGQEVCLSSGHQERVFLWADPSQRTAEPRDGKR